MLFDNSDSGILSYSNQQLFSDYTPQAKGLLHSTVSLRGLPEFRVLET